MKGLLYPKALSGMPLVASWLRFASSATAVQAPFSRSMSLKRRIERLAQQNALTQLEHLKTYPQVVARLSRGEIRLHAWYYDIPSGAISCFESESHSFRALSAETGPACCSIDSVSGRGGE